MKKIITLASILVVSGVAFANTQMAHNQEMQQTELNAVFGQHSEQKHQHRHNGYKDHKREGGFIDESSILKNLNEVKGASDDAHFMIEGNIIKQVGKRTFIFKDTSGAEHQIEVSKRAWHGQDIAPTDRIKIQGKVDKEWGKTELEVKNILKIDGANR